MEPRSGDDHENEARVMNIHVSGNHEDSQNQKDDTEPNDYPQEDVCGDRCEVGPENGDNHALLNHDVDDHAIEHHEIDRDSDGKVDQREPQTGSDHTREHVNPMNGNNHVLPSRDVNDHEIEYHEIGRPYKGGTCPNGMENGTAKRETGELGTGFPRTAPRIIQQFLEHRTDGEKPCQWSIDEYDGVVSWAECNQLLREAYQKDAELTTNQYHKLTHSLYQWEGMIEDLIERRERDEEQEQGRQKWQEIREGIRDACKAMYNEIINKGSEDDQLDKETKEVQKEFVHKQQLEEIKTQHLAMFEKCGGQRPRRRSRHEDWSDVSCCYCCAMSWIL